MRIATKDELLGLKPPTAELLIPELGEGVGVVVHAYAIGDILSIRGLISTAGDNLSEREKTDRLMSVVNALESPKLSIADTEALLAINDSIAQRIINKALELGGATQTAYDELKDTLRQNPYARRLYAACAEVFHCLPSDLSEKSEAEFMTAMAALEIEAEEAKKEE